MQRPVHLAVAILACAALAPALGARASASNAVTGPQVGQPAPDFTLTTLGGRRVRLSDYRGKTLVLNVWATWCPPCREETPDLIAAYQRLHAPGVAFLGVDDTERAPIVRAFAAEKGLPYPVALDRDQRFSRAYDIRYFPTTYVIDPAGIVRARNIDEVTPEELIVFVDAAARGRNVVIESPLQRRIDAVLAPSALPVPRQGAPPAEVAYARRVEAAIERAEALLDRSDPAKGQTIDFLRTRAMEQALRPRAIAALAAAHTSDPSALALLHVLRGDQAIGREAWSAAIAEYRAALRYSPADLEAWRGLETAAGPAKNAREQIDAAARLASLAPGSVDAQIELGVTYQRYREYGKAIAALHRANQLAMAAYRRAPSDAPRVRDVAATHLFLGRAYVAAGRPARAREAFHTLLAWAGRLPPSNSRHAMYLEEGSEAIAALDLGAAHRGAASITLAPWTGPQLPGSVSGSLKYRLLMTGNPGSTMTLAVEPLPAGWIASFCTGELCSPFRTQVAIPPGGVAAIEFQVLRAEAPRPDRATAILDATDGAARARATTTVDFAKQR